MKTLTIIASAFLSIMMVIGCGDKVSDNSIASDARIARVDSFRTVPDPDTIVLSFLRWYRNNYERLNAIPIVNNASDLTDDTTKIYSVNFDAAEEYLNDFQKSGYVSSTYLDIWRQYFKNAAENFKMHPQQDGPPEYFEYDFVMHSQEYDEDLNNLDSVKIDSRKENNNKATTLLIFVSGQKLKFQLSRHGDRWLIDQIDNASAR